MGPDDPGEMTYPQSGDEPETQEHSAKELVVSDGRGMLYGLGTNFNARISPDELNLISQRVQVARIDAQASSAELTREMIADAESVGMTTLTIFDTYQQLEEIPDGKAVEAQNEVNIGLGRPSPIGPNAYRDFALGAYEIAKRKGCPFWAGAAANFEKRDIDWFHQLDFASWPSDIGCATHHYTPGNRFEAAHKLNWRPSTWTRVYEVQEFRKAIGQRQWGITEFGYKGLSDADAAREIAKEWAFWEVQGAHWAFLYQIHDSPVDDHDFGLFNTDGTIKRAIWNTFPHTGET